VLSAVAELVCVRRMKFVIAILAIVGAALLLSSVAGLQAVHYSSTSEMSVVHQTPLTRTITGAIGLLFVATAFACHHRLMYGWYVVSALLSVVLIGAAYRAVYFAFTFPLSVPALLLGTLGELVRLAIVAWLLFRFWPRQRRWFVNA
jgi:hypothetical protein